MASTASIPIGASTSGHVLVQSVSRQTLQLFVGNNRFRCYIDQFGILGHIRGGFRRSRTIDGEYCKYSIGASTSGHVLVQSVSRQTLQLFVGNNRFRCYIDQFGIMGYIRGGFKRSRTIDGEYCKYSYRSQYLWPRTGVVGIPSDPPVICW